MLWRIAEEQRAFEEDGKAHALNMREAYHHFQDEVKKLQETEEFKQKSFDLLFPDIKRNSTEGRIHH